MYGPYLTITFLDTVIVLETTLNCFSFSVSLSRLFESSEDPLSDELELWVDTDILKNTVD